jgi:spermidine synthase
VLIFFFLVIAFHFLDLKRNKPGVKNEVEGSTSNIRSIVHPDGSKSVLINGIYFYGSDTASHKAQQLAAYLPLMINQQIRSALVIGFGTGMTASKLEEKGTSAIIITDMFPEAVRFSANAFADENNDILTNSHVSISLSDARSYLIQKTDKTDLITCGINLLYQMPGNYTTAFYKTGYEKLSESGILCQILPTQGITLPAFQSVIKSCHAVFPAVSLWYVAPEYVLMVASKNKHKPGYCHLSVNFAGMDSDQSLFGIKISNVESLLSHLLMDDKQLRSFTRDIPENTDDRPQVGYHPLTIRNINYQVLPELIKKSGNIPGFLSLEKDCEVDTAGVFRRIRLFNQILLQQDDLSSGS